MWLDHQEMMLEVGDGALEVCGLVAVPINLIPVVGSVTSGVLAWGCLFPGAFAVDYLSGAHGDRAGVYWSALGGLLAKKITRSVVFWGFIGLGVVLAVYQSNNLAPALVGDNQELLFPVATTGSLITLGLAYLIANALEQPAGNCAFEQVFYCTSSADNDDELDRAAGAHVAGYPPEGVSRWFLLMSAATGFQGGRGLWTTWIPVAGPILRAERRAQEIDAKLARLAKDTFREDIDRAKLLAGITTVVWIEEVLLSGIHLSLGVGAGFFLASAFAGGDRFNVPLFGVAAISTLVGAGFILLRELLQVVRPWAIAWSYEVRAPLANDVE